MIDHFYKCVSCDKQHALCINAIMCCVVVKEIWGCKACGDEFATLRKARKHERNFGTRGFLCRRSEMEERSVNIWKRRKQMKLEDFSAINFERCESPTGFGHAINTWSLSDWFTATVGELGEAANIAKKLNRVRDGIPGNGDVSEAELRTQLADEIADTFIYLDLLAQSEGIDLTEAVRSKFNRTSAKVGFAGQI